MTDLAIVGLWLAGMALLVVELFTPGLIVGALGCAALVASVSGAWVEWGPLPGGALGVGTFAAAAALLRWGGSRMALQAPLSAQAGFVATDDHSALLGQTGTAATTLRPAGFATIGGRRVGVVTLGELLEAGAPVEVLAVEGNRIVVRARDRRLT